MKLHPIACGVMLASLTVIPTAFSAELIAGKASGAIQLDGVVDAGWANAQPLQIKLDKMPYKPDNGYPGMTSTDVTLRALYDDQNIYLLVEYTDPTQSFERAPWIKQEDGSWKQLKKKDSTGHDNTYYEDKMALLWDINAKGFEKKGCDVACHMAVDGKIEGRADTAPGRKYLNAGQTVDMWHWKGVRTGPVGQTDDQFIDSTNDPALNKDWGRKGDDKTGGGYADNINAAGTGPAFMSSGEQGYWILDGEKVPFTDTFKPGDKVAGMIVAPFSGSRGDIATMSQWKDGKWIMEMRRTLVTSGANVATQDIQFKDLAGSYPFGISVFDNSQIDHLYHEKSHVLKFK